MYQPLAACSGCRRHVRASEVHCPFCGAERVPGVVESVAMVRMSRAATLAAALAIAGCRSEPTPIANDPAAAKPSAAPTPTPSPDTGLVDDPGGQVDIYGAPPPPPPSASAKPTPKPTVPAPPYGVPPPPKP